MWDDAYSFHPNFEGYEGAEKKPWKNPPQIKEEATESPLPNLSKEEVERKLQEERDYREEIFKEALAQDCVNSVYLAYLNDQSPAHVPLFEERLRELGAVQNEKGQWEIPECPIQDCPCKDDMFWM